MSVDLHAAGLLTLWDVYKFKLAVSKNPASLKSKHEFNEPFCVAFVFLTFRKWTQSVENKKGLIKLDSRYFPSSVVGGF